MSSLVRSIAFCGVLASSGATVGIASPVTVEPGEVANLRALVQKDPSAGREFAALRKVADSALKDRPNPLTKVVSAGRLSTDPDKIETTEALEDIEKAEALAWTFVVSGDERYAAKARDYIFAWASVNQSDGNPINETKFEPLIEAYDIVRSGFPADERAKVDNWLRNKAQMVWATTQANKENWQSHRIKIVGLVGATIGDEKLWKQADEGFKKQLNESFDAAGESIDFKRRDALHYHVYSIQPLLTMACVAQRRGESLYTYRASSGASLQRAVEFVVPFATGEKTHVEFVNSQVKFDRTRAAAGEKSYAQRNWNPRSSIRVFAEAGCVDPKYNGFASSVAGTPNKPYVNWRSVLNAASVAPRPR